MPQIAKEDVKPYQVYGQAEVDLTITIRERLMSRFAAHETVEVKNIDDEPIEWQFLPDHAETSTLTDDGIKITYRDEPELWRIEAGETDYMTGACAFIMIEALYKKLVIKKVGIVENPTSAKQIRNFNFKDPIRAEALIDKIYLGKVSPSFNQAQPNQVTPTKKAVAHK
jgi:hypothetical protein